MTEKEKSELRIICANSPRYAERNRKISQAMKGRKQTPEHTANSANARKGISPWSKGLTKDTDERLRKISENSKGRVMNKEWRDNLSKAKKGKPRFVSRSELTMN